MKKEKEKAYTCRGSVILGQDYSWVANMAHNLTICGNENSRGKMEGYKPEYCVKYSCLGDLR